MALDLRYADTNNFVGRKMYRGEIRNLSEKTCAIGFAEGAGGVGLTQNLGFENLGCLSPILGNQGFWELIKDDRYVANPARGSYHNQGSAVDLTIIDLRTGKES